MSAILDSFGEVFWGDVIGIIEVSNGTSEFEDTVIGSGGEVESVGGFLEQCFGFIREVTKLLDFLGTHLAIGRDREILESSCLPGTSSQDTVANVC